MSQLFTPVRDDNGMTRTAVVTGGNSGIGFAVAEALGKKGYKIWIAGRNAEKGATAVTRLRPHCAAGVEFLPLDVTLFARIEQFLDALKPQLGGRLDALVHSTGVVNSKRVVSADGLEEGWATQFLGRYLLTEALTPELSKSDDGRVVFISAQLMGTPRLFEEDLTLEKNYATMRAIQQAQYACQLYLQMYAAEHPNGPAINGGLAGLVRTGITRNQSGLLRVLLDAFTALAGISPERAAENFVALASDPAMKGVSGHFFPKPEHLEKRKKLAFGSDELLALRRVLAKYSETRRVLPSS